MKRIEDEFQPLADDLANGRPSLHDHEHNTVARFYALWRLRAQHRDSPVPDRQAVGVPPDPLSLDQQECLERNGYSFVGPDGMFPGRMLAGIQILRGIDFYVRELSGETWGVARAQVGEFVLPDNFGTTPIVPVTPKVCLIAGAGDIDLFKYGVKELNSLAVSTSSHYVVARAFAACPL